MFLPERSAEDFLVAPSGIIGYIKSGTQIGTQNYQLCTTGKKPPGHKTRFLQSFSQLTVGQ